MTRKLGISSFFLKLIAIITMTIDHVGFLLELLADGELEILQLSEIFRGIGRLSMPLFIFMIVEGMIHSKNINRYFLRLGIIASIISITYMVLEYSSLRSHVVGLLRSGNTFLDLLVVAFAIWAIKQKDNRKKLFILLPIALSLTSFFVKGNEMAVSSSIETIHWFPCFITMRYDWYSLLLGLLFYFSYLFADQYIKFMQERTSMDKEMWMMNGSYRTLVNIVSAFALFIGTLIYYLSYYMWPEGSFINDRAASMQLLAFISGAFILLYNGKRGYNAKWFQYGAYLYYPLHIVILVVIYIVINGGI